MGNRKLPFGYQMVMGEIVLHPIESGIAQEIFRRYAAGASYGELIEWLKEQGTPYETEKPWNKNMVARILDDCRYLGEKGFPAVIEKSTYDAAKQVRLAKQHPTQKTEAQVLLRKLCGHSATKTIEQQVLTILNRLISNPELLNMKPPSVNSLRAVELQRELDRVMQVQPVNEEKARELICQLASAQYENLGCEEYETIRLKHLLSGTEPMRELDAGLLGASVQKVIVTKTGVSLLMKNGQLISGDEVS